MHEANISTDELASKCGIKPYLIRKVLATDENLGSEYIPFTLPIVLGIGLELAPSEIHFFLEATGYVLANPGEPRNDTLAAIIDLPYPKTVERATSALLILTFTSQGNSTNIGGIQDDHHY